MKHRYVRCAAAILLVNLVSCGAGTPVAPPPAAASGPSAVAIEPAADKAVPVSDVALSAVNAPDRTETDKKLDPGRHPAELLSFFRVAPGMRVAEISAGGGYTTELLARTVGPSGKVYGQNAKVILERFAEKPWSERLAKPIMKNVVRVDRDFAEPLPAEAKDLDAVFCILFYHDLFWLDVDRDKMNKAIYAALKPGGTYAVVDHSARGGGGSADAKTLHRIDEKLVRAEIEKVGFRLRAEGAFLRNSADSRDWNGSPSAAGERRGTTDRFVLAFEKP